MRIIDDDDNGIITQKEMKNFAPCEGFDSKKLKKEFAEFGTKADLNDLADAFTPKLGMEMLI